MPHRPVDLDREVQLRNEEVDERTAGTVVGPVGVLGVGLTLAELGGLLQ